MLTKEQAARLMEMLLQAGFEVRCFPERHGGAEVELIIDGLVIGAAWGVSGGEALERALDRAKARLKHYLDAVTRDPSR